ncbi:MAG: hypothetical protein HLUCCO02_04880 [Idiomarinaceae bacterium HL-53]|nr:MAG: hypothetical protein HLUCCO02_04880 [Idiomarinaceae bacterium HL-53]CUS47892.1 hypothetical protein Ga0003345_0831 [Idiomarinaceae bacterium HL-53]
MNEHKSAALELTESSVDEELVTDYLEQNPDFFDRHPNLLVRMNMRHQQAGSVSLVERQQRILREQINALQEEITQLMGNARRNEQIFRGYSALYVELLNCETLEDVLQSLKKTFQEQLALPELSLKFFDSPVALPEQYTFSSDTHKQLLSKRFEKKHVYLGRISNEEQKLLFRDEQVESVALILLGKEQELGMLAFGSKDPAHFDPDMDYLLITQLQALLSVILPRLISSQDA